jgi:peptidoglycan-associated lipoprotein
MKLIKFATLLSLGIGIGLGSVGCKTHNPGGLIKFDENGKPIPGSGAEQTAGNAGKLDTDTSGIKTNPAEGIAMGNGHPGWPEDREALKADTIHFEYDSAVVKPAEHSKVTAVADYLKSNASNAVKVEGHCDERGTDEYNRSLGERRAQAIREELVKAGVEAGRVDTVSFGRDRPVDTGHSDAAHRKNRRGEFVALTPPK